MRQSERGETIALYEQVSQLALERGDHTGAERAAQRAAFSRLLQQGDGEPAALAFAQRVEEAHTLQHVLDDALEGAIALLSAELGNIQLVRPAAGGLRIVAQRGFDEEFLDYFDTVEDDRAACGRALLAGTQVVIADVDQDEGFAAHRRIAASSGFRSVQSTPLEDRAGRPLGMLSTHFDRPHRPSDDELHRTRLLARLTASVVERRPGAPPRIPGGRPPSLLQCEDCGARSGGPGEGWAAVRLERPGPAEPWVLTYCPACASQFDPEDSIWRLGARPGPGLSTG